MICWATVHGTFGVPTHGFEIPRARTDSVLQREDGGHSPERGLLAPRVIPVRRIRFRLHERQRSIARAAERRFRHEYLDRQAH